MRGRWRRWCVRIGGKDRGVASVELATLAVVVLMLAFLAIQTGFYFHAREVAQSAARHGAEAARQFGSGPGEGVAEAESFLSRTGSVHDAAVSSQGGADSVRITVRGTVATLVPGVHLSVNEHADAPVEKWSTP
ncbi:MULTISPECIES: TadE family protein [unclassified Streptomyces]|uniref:TadE family protein n=1 Tax=unclassified Streptomyces TaxID=2593676 RepID=UPI000BACC5CF|nr:MULTISPECIES: TadE family protein [unclassified Streptomyces]ASY37000.1 hypothetical protein CAC01_30645 [Streptomyces sp. CLI2509]MYX20443.1 pilus assembly protein [Streptomyces sp. SID8380]